MGTLLKAGNMPGTFKLGGLQPGYLACDGSVVSQTTYSYLFAAISTAYNTGGEGAGNFRLPDFRGRSPIGSGTGTGLTARNVGDQVGVETVTLTTPQIPSHTHTDAGHGHTFVDYTPTAGATTGPAATTTGAVANTVATSTAAANIQNTGGGGSHNNMHPSLACPIIIKY